MVCVFLHMTHASDGRLFVFVLVLVSLVILWGKKVKCLSSSVFALALGITVSLVWRTATSTAFEFAPEIFLYLLLPPMLLHSSFEFELSSLKGNWVGSLTFAFLGTLFSMTWIAIGILVWTRQLDMEISVPKAFLYAAVLAPTDTVATMGMTRSLSIKDKYVFQVLENESVMNDALSVVLVHLFKTMVNSDRDMSRWIPVDVVMSSLLTTSLSILLGVAFSRAMIRSKASSLTAHYLTSFLLYALCECFELSGILGLFVYGALICPPPPFRESVSSMSTIMEAYVYLTLGLAFHTYNWRWIVQSLLVLLSCIVGRVLMAYGFGFCLSKYNRRWTTKSILFFSMCGVRGAISYALSMLIGDEFIRSTTFVVIVCTIFMFGTFQKCLLHMLLI